MVDCAIILEKVEKIYKDLYKYMKSKGFDIWLNNLIFKLLMSLFIENTHKSIYLSIIDCLFIYNEIYIHKACLILLSLIREEIFKCQNLGDASNLFDLRIKDFKYQKFGYELIKKMRKNSKKNKPKNENNCDLDWPYCYKTLQEPNVQSIMRFKIIENILIENNYFDLAHNVYKLAETSSETREKELKKENSEIKKKTLIYGNLLIDRPAHKCGRDFSSREKILGNQSQRKSSLMTVFFEQSKKNVKEVDSNSEELMEMIHDKSDYMSDVNRSVLIESVIDLPKDNNDKEEDDSNDSNKINEIK